VADVVDTVFAVEEAATGKTSNDTSPLVSIVGAVRNLPLLILWLVVGCCVVVGGEYNGVAATACAVLCTIFNVCH
jgi:hypothetical protein